MASQTTGARIEKCPAADNTRIAYTTIGSGPLAVIGLHGWGGAGTGHSWREVLKHVAWSYYNSVSYTTYYLRC
jgi:hypothetical protein